MLCSYKNSCFLLRLFLAINVSVEVLGSAGALFIDVLGDLDFKLTRLVLKTYWTFSNEIDLIHMYNFMPFYSESY